MYEPTIRFDDYALQQAARLRPGSGDELFASRRKIFRRMLRLIPSQVQDARTIADVGCGAGDLLLFLEEETGAQIHGFDVSRSQLDLARARCRDKQRIRCHADLAETDTRFDLIFSLHVIEHVPDSELRGFLVSMLERLTPEGRLVIATPNGLNPFAYTAYMAMDGTHVRMHSPLTLNQLVEPLGFQVLEIHRETPQAHDLSSAAKTAVWWLYAQVLKLGVLAVAPGVRALRFPMTMAASFYAVIGRAPGVTSVSPR
jgi:2-polyprenyl-3-methyl-5-hydroxy-6-metoxy-1,4-benzoquinol methylase